MEENSILWNKPILIGATRSSGSTLLSVMLDAHPQIMCGPEISLFSHPFFWRQSGTVWRERLIRYLDLGYDVKKLPEWKLENGVCPYVELVYGNTLPWYGLDRSALRSNIETAENPKQIVEEFFGSALQSHRKSIWAEKSPPNLYAFKAFLEVYPTGRAIFLIRDGRDVICSILRRGFPFKQAVSNWLVETAMARTFLNDPRVFEMRYEDLVLQPSQTLNKLLEFLEVEGDVNRLINYVENSSRVADDFSTQGYGTWQSNPRQPLSPKSVGQWKHILSPEQESAFLSASISRPVPDYPEVEGAVAMDLMQQFGYDVSEALDVNQNRLYHLINDEGFLINTCIEAPKDDFHEFHEQYVESDTSYLPGEELDWKYQRLLSDIDRSRRNIEYLRTILEFTSNQTVQELKAASGQILQKLEPFRPAGFLYVPLKRKLILLAIIVITVFMALNLSTILVAYWILQSTIK